ncbi:unnamed protein product [Phyllotreta striolata]|uniref:Leucine-rich repeat-containing protein 40 n=1 Tax=Phyllotreta striolata TaxID=444603 RepID=A0A9N9XNB8_PHYSR|nr:unnamed protein product [Phyllotreta striolata]
MDKQSVKMKSRRKIVNPVFHLQTKQENDQHITKDVIRLVKNTGKLNLSSKHLSAVPDKMFAMYELTNENEINIDLSRTIDEGDAWWSIKPLTHLDISSNVLTAMPKDINMFQDLLVLNLQGNLLTQLPEEIGDLKKLTTLSLNHNKLSELPKSFFKLTELKQLFINDNNLSGISKDISDLVMLEKLDLSNNKILKLPSGIGFLVRLIELSISHNKLKKLPPDIVNIRALLKLDISHNSITSLPPMGELRKLQILYAQHNDITDIPSFIGCEQLYELHFGNNFIQEIPQEFCEYTTHLKILELQDNQLKSIPAEITKIARLEKLDITNNDIEDIPNTIGIMPHLHLFKIEGNKLKHIRSDVIRAGTNRILKLLRDTISDEDIAASNVSSDVSYDSKIYPDRYSMRNGNILNLAMKDIGDIPEECFVEANKASVCSVDISKNKFVNIPSGLIHVSKFLTELNVSSNRIREIPEFLKDFTNLKFCDLSKNQLETLPHCLSELVFMRELILSNNRFKNIPSCIFGMIGLEILLCNDNAIEEIPIDELVVLKRLTRLDLSNNNINFVPPQLGNMTQLRALELKGNPFRQPRYAVLEQGTESVLSYLRDKIPT